MIDLGFLYWVLLQARLSLSEAAYNTLCRDVSAAMAADFLGHDAIAFLAQLGVPDEKPSGANDLALRHIVAFTVPPACG